MKINIKNEETLITPQNLTLDGLADQWTSLVLAHIQANRNKEKYNDYKFPNEIKKYEK